jgi:lipoate-protein ligase A
MPAAANMAIDESLLRHAQAPVLRLYGWEEACVSIGYFQKTSVVPAEASFVRRYTGGGLVAHGKDLTYTLVLPADHPLTAAGTLPSYRVIHEGVASALRAVGVGCRLATAQPKKDHASCFLKPVPADVLDPKGNKLAGAAQRRTTQGCLAHGAIHFLSAPHKKRPHPLPQYHKNPQPHILPPHSALSQTLPSPTLIFSIKSNLLKPLVYSK